MRRLIKGMTALMLLPPLLSSKPMLLILLLLLTLAPAEQTQLLERRK